MKLKKKNQKEAVEEKIQVLKVEVGSPLRLGIMLALGSAVVSTIGLFINSAVITLLSAM